MFNFFLNDQPTTSYPIKKYSKWDYIKRRYLSELFKIKDYYRKRERAVNNSNILTRIVNTLTSNTNMDIVSYYKAVSTNAKYVSKQFNVVSNINNGKVLNNILYKNNSDTILLYTEYDIDLFTFEDNWIDYSPLRVIYTTNTDLDYRFPYEDVSFYTPTLTIYEIDIVTMLLQYRSWANERSSMGESVDANVYVATVLLPNTLDNILDMTIYNRFIDIAQGKQLSQDFSIDHPFHVLNYSSGIDSILTSVVKDIKNTNITLEQFMMSIPTINNTNMLETLFINNKYYTTQSEWVLWLARIEDIYTILILLGKKGRKRNLGMINRLPVIIKIIERRQSKLEMILPVEYYSEFTYYSEKIKKLIGRR